MKTRHVSILGGNHYNVYVSKIRNGSYSNHIIASICKALSHLILCFRVGADGLRYIVFQNLVLGALSNLKAHDNAPTRWGGLAKYPINGGETMPHVVVTGTLHPPMQRPPLKKGWCQRSLATWTKCWANQAPISSSFASHVDSGRHRKTKSRT